MADIHDLGEVRRRRQADEEIRTLAERRGSLTISDLYGKDITIDGHAGGLVDENEKDKLILIFYGPEAAVLGALMLSPRQWEELKVAGDRLCKEWERRSKESS